MGEARRQKMGVDEKSLIIIVVFSTMAVVASLLMLLIPTPSEQAETELGVIADDYYLNYLYPRLVTASDDLGQAFEKYDVVGVPTIFLRQLLRHNNGQYRESSVLFQEIGCDTNRTGVRYYPKYPYGPNDYEKKYFWACSKKAD